MTTPTSFPSKAAQNGALYHLSRRLRDIGRAQDDLYHSLSGAQKDAATDVYYKFPDTIGSLRDSHINAAAKVYPQFSNELRGLIVARDLIKAIPIIKPVSKAAAKKAELEIVLRDRGANDTLRAEMMKMAPKLAEDFEAHVRRMFDKDPQSWQIGRFVNRTRALDGSKVFNIDTDYLAKQAKQYGEDTATIWYHKMASKLGAAVDVKVVKDQLTSDVNVQGTVDGKHVEIRQQIVYKVSNRGTHFHQFPARIYVDDRFFTEAQFAECFHAVNAGGAK
jgi:hypothetical protein